MPAAAPTRSLSTPPAVEVEVDRLELSALLTVGPPPSVLPCGRCGVQQGHHRATATCPTFVRPNLPEGYAYADRLRVGQTFRFLPAAGPDCLRRVSEARCCVTGELTELMSAATDCEPATHWVQGSLVVSIAQAQPASGQPAPRPPRTT